MKFEEFYLSEMLVVGKPQDKANVLAFDKWIYILDDEPNEEVFLDILKKLGLDERDEFDNLKKNFDFEDVYSFITSIQEYVNDVLAGQINGKDLYLYDYGSFKHDPKSSILVKKVVKQLGLKSASYVEDVDSTETKVTKKKMTGEIPNTGYHGTSSKYFYSIMSKGIRAGESDTNYAKQGVYHDDLIFFATRIGEAMHHAQHTATEKGGIPIILEFKIPDKDLIIPDYDVTQLVGVFDYYKDYEGAFEKKDSSTTYKRKPLAVSKEFGVYGYEGNIKPSFITNVYVATKPADRIYNINDFKKMKPKIALRQIEYFEM